MQQVSVIVYSRSFSESNQNVLLLCENSMDVFEYLALGGCVQATAALPLADPVTHFTSAGAWETRVCLSVPLLGPKSSPGSTSFSTELFSRSEYTPPYQHSSFRTLYLPSLFYLKKHHVSVKL